MITTESGEGEPQDEMPYVHAYWNQRLRGKYASSWPRLCEACASSLIHAARETGNCLESFNKSQQKCKSRGEVWLLTNLNYHAFLSGPLLSCVVLSALANEAFLNLAIAISLREKLRNQKQIDSELENLRTATFERKLEKACILTEPERFNRRVRRDVLNLMKYRNSCAHDVPRWLGNPGEEFQFDRRRRETIRLDRQSLRFPLLGDRDRVFGLKDALWAVQCHDRMVKCFLDSMWPSFVRYHADPAGRKLCSIIGNLPSLSVPVGKVEGLAEAWSLADSWLKKVTLKEQREIGAKLRTKQFHVVTNLKPCGEDKT
jgi:hypothetical protein